MIYCSDLKYKNWDNWWFWFKGINKDVISSLDTSGNVFKDSFIEIEEGCSENVYKE